MARRAAAVKITRRPRRPIIIRKKKWRTNAKLATVGAVKRIIARGRENKMVSHQVEKAFHNSLITNADFYPIMPQVVQGGDDCQRVGNKIQPKGLYVKGEISLCSNSGQNFQSNLPIRVRVLILSMRNVKQTNLIAPNINYLNLLVSNDDATATHTVLPYDGSVTNHMYPVNKDMYIIHKDYQFTLCPDNQDTTANDGSPLYKAHRFFKFKISTPKYLTFDYQGGGLNWPINFAPFCAIGYCFPDGTAPDTTQTKIATNVRSFLYYEDS